MGMYTELIFGAELKKETPSSVIEALKYMLGDREDKPEDFPLSDGRCEWLFQGASYYFGISSPVNRFTFDSMCGTWQLSTRSNIKNYGGEIEEFLAWIKPHIESGSGIKDMYALAIYEESEEPTLYYLN